MNLYLLLPAIAVAANLGLAAFALRGQWRAGGHRVLALFLLSMALWGGAIFLMRSSLTPEDALQWDKLVIINFALIGVTYLHFTYRFSGLSPRRWVLPAAYGFVVAAAIFTFQGYIVTGMQMKFYGYAPVLGIAFYPFLAFVYITVFTGLSNVIHTYRHAASVGMRNRAAYILAGTACSLIGGTTDFLPVLGVPIYPLGIAGNLLFALAATAAMVRDHLADIRHILRRSLAYAVFTALLVGLYALAALLVERLFQVAFSLPALLLTLAFVAVSAAGLPHLLDRVQQLVDRGFYRQRYRPLKALERFSQEMKDITDLNSLANSLVVLVRAATSAHFVSLLLPRTSRHLFRSAATVGIEERFQLPYGSGNTALARLTQDDRVLTAQEVILSPEWQAIPARERARLEGAGVRLYVPVKAKGQLTGLIILGPKVHGGVYTQEDIDLLQTVAHQAATAMENARLYQELQDQLRELQETQAQLLQTERLASVGTLAAGVAHEISNPIFAISGRAELLLKDPDRHLRTEKAREYIAVMHEMAQRVDGIVRGLLGFARDDQAFAPVILNAVAEQTIQLVEHDLRLAGIEVKREYQADLPPVLGSNSKLQQVLLNLLLNARDAMSEGGIITLRTETQEGSVKLFCIDSGEGIPVDRLGHIFDAFYTTKEVGKGTGLGLYLCQKIVQEHSGRISVQSTPRQGATFSLTFPATSPEALPEEAPSPQGTGGETAHG